MSLVRPYVLSVAGFDPSGGAGILADIKTFEMHQVQGMGVCTSVTFQNENKFEGLIWMDTEEIRKQMTILFEKYSFDYVKIGLVRSLKELDVLIDFMIGKNATIKIIWDPILKASAGYDFHKELNTGLVTGILKKIHIVIPNLNEIKVLHPGEEDEVTSAERLSRYCMVFLKGGHSETDIAEDILFVKDKRYSFSQHKIEDGEKHGSGCVLSSSLTALLAKGFEVKDACGKAKKYTSDFLSSNKGLLGYHYQ
jgi:hydroxymethylpyrimidine/phosphomethylpyrimidine kinase